MSEEALTMADVKRVVDEFDSGCFGGLVNKFIEKRCGDGVEPKDLSAEVWFETLPAIEVVRLAKALFGESTGVAHRVRKAAKIEDRHCPECDNNYEDSDPEAARRAFPLDAAVEVVRNMLASCPAFVGETDVEVKSNLDPTVIHVKPSSRDAVGQSFAVLKLQLADDKDPVVKALATLGDEGPGDLGTLDERLARIIVAAQRLIVTKV